MALSVRVTHRTDTRGTVNADFRGLYELNSLAAASKAGMPPDLLHPSGWNGDEDDVRGLFAEQIYRLGEIHFRAPDAIERIAGVINFMQQICRGVGVDPKAAIPYDMARFLRELHESGERRASIVRGEVPLPVESDFPYREGRQ